MSFFALTILVCALSFGGIISLLGFRLYSTRELSTEQLCEGMLSSGPFFEEFDRGSASFAKLLKRSYFFAKRKLRWFVPWSKGLVSLMRKYWCYFSNYVHGRHLVEKGGCKGYWKEINGEEDSLE